jgi:hypothetical protein
MQKNSSHQEFRDLVSFELIVIKTFLGRADPFWRRKVGTLDLTDPGNPTMSHSAKSLDMGGTSEFKNDILPLLFGTSWKILDLMVEYELNRCGIKPSRRNFLFKEKKIMPRDEAWTDQFSDLTAQPGTLFWIYMQIPLNIETALSIGSQR